MAKNMTPKYVKNAFSTEEFKFEPKYILTDITRIYNGVTLYRIQALRRFDLVMKGDLGGWVSDGDRLSQHGNCWVDNDAIVYERGTVSADAWATENTVIMGNAKLWGKACIFGKLVLEGDCNVGGGMQISGDWAIRGTLSLKDNATLESQEDLNDFLVAKKKRRAA